MSQIHREEHDGLTVLIDFGNPGELFTPLIHAPTGVTFGLHDPEAWEYVSFERRSAQYIAQGFPDYWANRPEELRNDDTADDTASKSRKAGMYSFSKENLPSVPLAFKLGSFSSSNPFEVLQRQLKEQGENQVSLSLWRHYCESLFRQLINSRVARSPEIFFFSPVRDWTMHRIPSRDDSRSFAYRADFDVYSEFIYCSRISGHLVRLVHRQGDFYRLYQPETWQYVSLSRQIADDICGGFPEYWDDRPDEELEPNEAVASASLAHRRKVISRLAAQPIPLPDLFRLRKSSLMHLPEATRDELAAIRTSNPFLLIEQQLHHSTKPESPSSDVWRSSATQLFEYLLTSKHVVKQPSFVGVPEWEMQPWEDDEEQTAPTLVEQCQPTDATPPVPDDVSHQRGPTLISQETLESLHKRSDKRPVQWGPLFYEETDDFSHFCVAGMPRSGKTTLLRLLFQSLHTNVKPPPRFVFYDAKANLLPFMFPPGSLAGDGSDDEAAEALFILSPFDERGTAWDIAKDATNQLAAREVAEILFPEPDPSKKDAFFSPAARDVAVDVMRALTRKAETKWSLFDLLCSLQLENIEAVMSSNPGGAQRYKAYFQGTSGSTDDLIKTLRTKTAMLLPAANAWRFARERLSLRDWAKSHTKSIVLFHVKKYTEAAVEINRILLNILSQELLTIENPPARTFLYLDEFEHLERIKQMTSLAHDGASLKVNMALAFHDLGTLEEVYRGATEGILGDATFQAFLKVRTRSTSDWASDQIGSPEVKVKQKNTQRGSTKHEGAREADPDRESSQASESETEHYAIRRLVLPDEVRYLPMPDEVQRITGYFVAPGHGPYLGTLPASKLYRSTEEYLAAQTSEENFYALWPKTEGVSERCPHPDERYDTSDDTFLTLHQLGFEKPGYAPSEPVPPPATPPSPTEPPTPDEQERSIQPPPSVGRPPDEVNPQPPNEQDYGIDFDFKHPD